MVYPMRERHWYTRFGIEPPFPWVAVFWPVLWAYAWVTNRTAKPEPQSGTVRLWDKHFNLLATYPIGDPIYATVDRDGTRWSGPVQFEVDE